MGFRTLPSTGKWSFLLKTPIVVSATAPTTPADAIVTEEELRFGMLVELREYTG